MPCTLYVLKGNAAPGGIGKTKCSTLCPHKGTHKAFFLLEGLWEKKIIIVRCSTSEIHSSPLCLLLAFKINHFN